MPRVYTFEKLDFLLFHVVSFYQRLHGTAVSSLHDIDTSIIHRKRVWLKATTTPPSESAIKLLEEIQEQGNCCGFGPKDTCQVNLNVSKPMLLGPETSIQQCGQIKTEYCSGTALSNQTFGFDCSQSLGLDLPYLGDGMSTNLCQSRSSSGCSTAWTAYLQRNLRMFGQLLLLMALVMVCG